MAQNSMRETRSFWEVSYHILAAIVFLELLSYRFDLIHTPPDFPRLSSIIV